MFARANVGITNAKEQVIVLAEIKYALDLFFPNLLRGEKPKRFPKSVWIVHFWSIWSQVDIQEAYSFQFPFDDHLEFDEGLLREQEMPLVLILELFNLELKSSEPSWVFWKDQSGSKLFVEPFVIVFLGDIFREEIVTVRLNFFSFEFCEFIDDCLPEFVIIGFLNENQMFVTFHGLFDFFNNSLDSFLLTDLFSSYDVAVNFFWFYPLFTVIIGQSLDVTINIEWNEVDTFLNFPMEWSDLFSDFGFFVLDFVRKVFRYLNFRHWFVEFHEIVGNDDLLQKVWFLTAFDQFL